MVSPARQPPPHRLDLGSEGAEERTDWAAECAEHEAAWRANHGLELRH